MASSFVLVTRATAPVEQLFDVSLSIDEHVASMEQSGERAIGGVTSGSIALGETVTWRARHFGIWFTMTSRITSLERPQRFVDEQVRGPFRSFRHEHSFTRDGQGTVMLDTLTIGSPIFGRLAERIVLVPYLRRLIRERNHHILTTLDAVPGTNPRLPTWPADASSPFRRSEVTALIGHGDECWERAAHDVPVGR
jgi:ligand-binding SRPBCC domain-containing protein